RDFTATFSVLISVIGLTIKDCHWNHCDGGTLGTGGCARRPGADRSGTVPGTPPLPGPFLFEPHEHKGWQRSFDDPILIPGGRQPITAQDWASIGVSCSIICAVRREQNGVRLV